MRPSGPVRRAALATSVFGLLLAAVPAVSTQAAERPQTIREPLWEAMQAAAPNELIPISIVLREQVARAEVAKLAEMPMGHERRMAIARRLRETAERTQAPMLAFLKEQEVSARVARLRPLWIGNVIGVDTTLEVIEALARWDAVDHINYNPKVDVFLGPPACLDVPRAAGRAAVLPAPAAVDGPGTDEVECGNVKMRAPEVWNEGNTGEGAVIAMIDTGVCWNHPDIRNQIWINPGEDMDHDGVLMDSDDMNGVDNDGNGFVDDLIGWDFDFNDNNPNDDSNGHGSHTAGTVAGDGTSGTQAGMAPDARLMVLRVGVNFSDEVDVWSAMQYAADNAANSISMSLGWPHNQNPDRPTWRQNSENTIDMGTAMVIAAGNEGFGNEPDNVRTPGDVPRVITVGATDCNDVIAGFSSRGPITWQSVPPFNDWPFPPGLVKPDVSAPGVDTKSHAFCSGYTLNSGTSMATPHVAGAVALMVSNDPSLTHDEIKEILEETSIDLGTTGKDNVFGSGRVDAFLAVDAAQKKVRYISHQVFDTDPNYGNGDGGVDTGETLSVVLHIKNETPNPVTNVRAFVTTSSPGVRVRTNTVTFPDLAPGQEADSLAPQLTFTVDAGCFFDAAFQVEIRWNEPIISKKNVTVRVGSSFPAVLFDNDFESSAGPWTAGSIGATDGFFVRANPVGTTDGLGQRANPEDDHTPGAGVQCWTTGNGGPPLNSDDVDGGSVTLTTSAFDVHDWETMTISYWRWFYTNPITLPGGKEYFNAEFSSDGGANWAVLDNVITTVNTWTSQSFNMAGRNAFTSNLRFRFVVRDDPINGEQNVEGAVDDVKVEGTRVLCDSFSEPAHLAPNGIGSSLRGAALRPDVRWTWTAPPVDGGHHLATRYRVWTSASPSGGFAETASPTGPALGEMSGMSATQSRYYLVTAANSGGDSPDLP